MFIGIQVISGGDKSQTCVSISRVVFKHVPPNLYNCRRRFKEELKWLTYKAKRKELTGLIDWVQAFR